MFDMKNHKDDGILVSFSVVDYPLQAHRLDFFFLCYIVFEVVKKYESKRLYILKTKETTMTVYLNVLQIHILLITTIMFFHYQQQPLHFSLLLKLIYTCPDFSSFFF